ncbi:hypothetical protein VitviT2T_015280 [Vitis vinifera]|uniref:GDSL esterase/lipase n=1 Tax=Vitis vinifera TaxID=29760 RepID=A0ABY9CQ47_VITVI|nr:hypothetical protein VitviT2T_015280 [Vitis vinifera]
MPELKKCWALFVQILLLSNLQLCAHGEPEVPCYFIFGDSLSDGGNNNGLVSLAKANYPPNGIDFPSGPTGRFCNGRTIVDVTADLLQLENYIPPFATASDQQILQGVNYASGSAGIRDETAVFLGERIVMNQQLQNFQTTVSQITGMQGNNETAAMNFLSKCLFTIGIGSNDIGVNYYGPLPLSSIEYTPDQFTALLIDQYSQQLRILYQYGARKLALFGVSQIGCTPALVAWLMLLVDDLNNDLTDAKFTYINIFEIQSSLDLAALGFRVTDDVCCGTSLTGCIPFTTPCENRSEYVYWDFAHPSEATNVIFAGRAYSAQTPSDAHPIDIHTLAQL